MKGKDYIPKAEKEFYPWVQNLVKVSTLYTIAWEIPPRAVTNLTDKLTMYNKYYLQAIDPVLRTKIVVQAKNDAREELVTEVRSFSQGHLMHNDLVKNSDRDMLQLPLYSSSRTPAPAPTSHPIASVGTATHQEHNVGVMDSNETTPRGGLPVFVGGVEVWCSIGDELPTKDSDFTYVCFSSTPTFKVHYRLEDVGKSVFYRFRWISTSNLPGGWSEIVQAVIP
jgi:hypothetical protein